LLAREYRCLGMVIEIILHGVFGLSIDVGVFRWFCSCHLDRLQLVNVCVVFFCISGSGQTGTNVDVVPEGTD